MISAQVNIMANIGLFVSSFTWWDNLPNVIKED